MWNALPALVLLGISLLCVFRAPTNFLWKVGIVVSEFNWIPLLITGIGVSLSIYFAPDYWWIHSLYLSAFVLFALPVIRAYTQTSKLRQSLEHEFGAQVGVHPKSSPYAFVRSFKWGTKPYPFEEMVYQHIDGRDYTYRFYAAKIVDPAPLVIVVHGGSWAGGDAGEIPALNSYLAYRGIHVAAINYRLAPQYKYPAQVDDVAQLISHLSASYPEGKFSKIVLLGRSAGGQIALQSAYSVLRNRISGVIAFYAPADMLWGAQQITTDWVLDVDKVLLDYIGCSVKEDEAPYIAASAPPLVNEQTPPTLLIHGKIDAMVSPEHSTRLLKKLRQYGVKAHFISLSSATHGCDFNFNGPSGQISTFAIERFIVNV